MGAEVGVSGFMPWVGVGSRALTRTWTFLLEDQAFYLSASFCSHQGWAGGTHWKEADDIPTRLSSATPSRSWSLHWNASYGPPTARVTACGPVPRPQASLVA